MTRLTKGQKARLQQLARPHYPSVPTGNPTQTDVALADRGLVTLTEVKGQTWFIRTDITAAGRALVPEDDYEHCHVCGTLTHKDEYACIGCGADKPWADAQWSQAHDND